MQEKKDGAMVKGATGLAHMPQNLIMKYYPKGSSYMPEGLNDGLSGIDSQMSSDVGGAKKNLSKTKF